MVPAPDSPRRPNSLRLPGYDYSTCGAYHIVMRCHLNRPLLGRVSGRNCLLSDTGLEAERIWLEIPQHYPGVLTDAYSIMPNHFHGILLLIDPSVGGSGLPKRSIGLPQVVQRYKSFTTHRFRQLQAAGLAPIGGLMWQRGYWDEIITSEKQLEAAQEYVANNVLSEYLRRQGMS